MNKHGYALIEKGTKYNWQDREWNNVKIRSSKNKRNYLYEYNILSSNLFFHKFLWFISKTNSALLVPQNNIPNKTLKLK